MENSMASIKKEETRKCLRCGRNCVTKIVYWNNTIDEPEKHKCYSCGTWFKTYSK